jgi:2-oxoglutarate dehydrogenase E2 component (dihydrolipoamide succinyltransferase)
MAIDVTIPAAGESITTANVAHWHMPNGSHIRKGEVLVTLETDKVSNELEAAADGILHIIVGEGEEVAIGTLIATIDDAPAEPVATVQAPVVEPATPPVVSVPVATAAGVRVDLVVPGAGESITSASIGRWHKSDGDSVVSGEVLVTLETDKVSNELEAPATGILHVLSPEGSEVPIGAVIGFLMAGEASAAAPEAPVQQAAVSRPVEPVATSPVKPGISQFANAAGISQPATAPVSDGRTTRRKMSMLRRKIATQLVSAQHTAAILTTFNEVDMSEVMELRKRVQDDFMKKHGVKLGFMSFFVKAVVQALKDVPQVNGRIDGTDVVENHFYDIGVAVGTEKGLVVPVLRDCDTKSFACLERDILGYAQKVRDGKMVIEDLQGGVFTISNGGVYGSLLSTPILNPPQSAILGMHTIQQRPIAVDGRVEIRPMMYLALSYDHRLIDGKVAVTFLIRIKECLENPTRLLLEM